MITTTVSLGDLVDRTLHELEAPVERGRSVVLAAQLAAASTQATFSAGTALASDLIEFGSEVVQVASVSTDPVPVYTLFRGFANTPRVDHANATAGTVNPQFTRFRTAEAIRRAFPRLEALGVPLLNSATLQRREGANLVELPADCREVLQVLYFGYDDTVQVVGDWREFDNLPASKVESGRALRVPPFLDDTTELEVIYRSRYLWSESPAFPDEGATVVVPEAAQDLPAQYAAAWLLSGREISRQQIDRAEESAVDDPGRVQSGGALVRAKWQEFYRSVDEAARVTTLEIPKHRPFITMPQFARKYPR